MEELKNLYLRRTPNRRYCLSGKDVVYMLPFGEDLNQIHVGRSSNGVVSAALSDIDIGIPNSFVSKNHCHIIGGEKYGEPGKSRFYVVDKNSKNGTFLNGKPVNGSHKNHWLLDRCILSLAGRYDFTMRSGFVDEEGNPIDKDGNLIDLEGKLQKRIVYVNSYNYN